MDARVTALKGDCTGVSSESNMVVVVVFLLGHEDG
jgi:hypothetical protein